MQWSLLMASRSWGKENHQTVAKIEKAGMPIEINCQFPPQVYFLLFLIINPQILFTMTVHPALKQNKQETFPNLLSG